MPTALPPELTKHLADSEVEVVSWSATSQELTLSIAKEINAEKGILVFSGVAHVELAPCFTIESISCSKKSLHGVDTEQNETAFLLNESWGYSYCVVAESIRYEVCA